MKIRIAMRVIKKGDYPFFKKKGLNRCSEIKLNYFISVLSGGSNSGFSIILPPLNLFEKFYVSYQ